MNSINKLLARFIFTVVGLLISVYLSSFSGGLLTQIIVISYLISVLTFETLVFLKSRLLSPESVVALGWVLPLLLANFPLELFIFTFHPLSDDLNSFAILIISLFYGIGVLIQSTSNETIRTNSYMSRNGIKRFKSPLVPFWVIVALFLVSNSGFMISLESANWVAPVFRSDVTMAAKEFFKTPGSAALFYVGRIAMLLTLATMITRGIKVYGKNPTIILAAFSALFILEMMLRGKRMGVVLTIISCFLLYAAVKKLKRSSIFSVGLLLVVIVFGNAYLRAGFGYAQYWEGRDFHKISGRLEYSLLMPMQYTRTSFGNLGDILTGNYKGKSEIGSYTLESFSSRKVREDKSDLGRSLNKGQMVTALAAPLQEGGLIFGLIWAAFLFSILWVFYVRRYNEWGMVAYSLLASRIGVFWTGNFLTRSFIYEYIVLMLCWIIVLTINGMSWKYQNKDANRIKNN